MPQEREKQAHLYNYYKINHITNIIPLISKQKKNGEGNGKGGNNSIVKDVRFLVITLGMGQTTEKCRPASSILIKRTFIGIWMQDLPKNKM